MKCIYNVNFTNDNAKQINMTAIFGYVTFVILTLFNGVIACSPPGGLACNLLTRCEEPITPFPYCDTTYIPFDSRAMIVSSSLSEGQSYSECVNCVTANWTTMTANGCNYNNSICTICNICCCLEDPPVNWEINCVYSVNTNLCKTKTNKVFVGMTILQSDSTARGARRRMEGILHAFNPAIYGLSQLNYGVKKKLCNNMYNIYYAVELGTVNGQMENLISNVMSNAGCTSNTSVNYLGNCNSVYYKLFTDNKQLETC